MEFLPHHILVEIFTNLDKNSLFVACKVCQLWSELIRSTPSIMKLVSLKITSNRSRQLITIHDQLPCGRHQNLIITDFCGDPIILKQLMAMHRITIANVKIARPAQWHATLLTEAFGALRNLSHLTLESCQLSGCDSIKESNFERLKFLRITNCNCEIFNVFARGCWNLSSLSVEYSQLFDTSQDITMKYLTILLKNIENLQNLSLIGVTKFNDENPLDDDFKFKLKRLIVDDFNLSNSNVIKFLAKQTNSMRYLRVFRKLNDDVVTFVNNEMKLINFEN